jgi:hypothetical protein
MRNTRFASRFARLPELDAMEVGRPHFRFKNPVVEGMLELITQSLYDYYEVALATVVTLQRLFTIQEGGAYTPAGGAAFNKNRIHTNLSQAGMLEAPNKHLCRALGVFLHPSTTPNDANRFAANFYLNFLVNRKSYLEGQLGLHPGGAGVFIAGTQNNVGSSAIGWPKSDNLYTFDADKAVQIEQQQNLAVVLDPTQIQAGAFTTDAAAANPIGVGIRAWVHLHGDLARAVQ